MNDADARWAKLVSLAVHELRTPINVVSGYLKMLLDGHGGPLGATHRQAIESADQASDRIIDVLAELSEIARLEDGRLSLTTERVPIRSLLADAAARFQPPAGIHATCTAAGPLPDVTAYADAARVARGLAAIALGLARSTCEGDVVLDAHLLDAHVAVTVGATRTRPAPAEFDALLPLPLGEGGLGVSLVLAQTVFQRLGARAGLLRRQGEPDVAVVVLARG